MIHHLSNFSKKITWSALGGIGNSKIARLTILMPAVGYLILFNSKLQHYLQLSLPKLGMQAAPSEVLISLSHKNMYFLYFGLLVFGLGMTMYAIFAPQQVKKYGSAEDYMRAMEDVRTDNIVMRCFNDTAWTYFSSTVGKRESTPEFPNDLNHDLHSLIEDMYEALEEDDKDSHFYNEDGDLSTGDILEKLMYSESDLTHKIKILIGAKIKERHKDVFNLQFRALDYERPSWRLFVFSFFGIGMLLTFIPTLNTSAIIFLDWIS